MADDPPRLFEDTRDLLTELGAAKVDFIVVGAHALAAHGLPRATADFDVFVRPSVENAERLMRALDAFGAPTRAHGVDTDDFTRPGMVYQLGLPPRRIDILTSISGLDFEAAWSSRLVIEIGALRLPVLGREALILNKLASGRKKDLLDVEALRASGEAAAQPGAQVSEAATGGSDREP